MNERDAQAIRDYVRRTSNTRNAVVLSLTNGIYKIRYRDTGAVVEAEGGQTGVTYPVEKEVIIQQDGSGRAFNKRPRIIGIAQGYGNGVIAGELRVSEVRSAMVIDALPAYPIRLVKGGASEAVVIRGRALVSAVYSSVHIVDSVAQSNTGSDLTLMPKALATCPAGVYSLTIGTKTIPDFFDVA